MNEVTIGEVARNQEAYFKSSEKNHERTASLLQDVLLQVTKTNGRVSSLEESRKAILEVQKTQGEAIDSLVNYKWWVLGLFAFVTISGGFTYNAAINQIKSELRNDLSMEINKGIVKAFEENVSEITRNQ